jgi:MarR family transcriptional regulator, organic hydroperoxide resistance regulator
MGAPSRILNSTIYLLLRSVNLYREQMADALGRAGLHPGQELVLAQLWRENGLTEAQLVERIGVEPADAANVLKGMERGGLLHRERDPLDRRAWRVWLTEHGTALQAEVEASWTQVQRRMLGPLTKEEATTLHRLLTKLVLGAPIGREHEPAHPHAAG